MSDWSDEDMETLKRMTVEGHSASEIGSTLGRTRNAIVGKWYRAGISVPKKTPTGRRRGRKITGPAQPRPPLPKRAPRVRPKAPRGLPRWKPKASSPPPPNGEVVILLPPLNVELKDLPSNGCTWPMNDGGPFLYCGRDREGDRSYCPGHRSRLRGS
jgi:GcrA cell cycle regulator